MNDFFQSKFVQDLKGGKLPPVQVEFSAASLMQVCTALVITAVIILLVAKILKNV